MGEMTVVGYDKIGEFYRLETFRSTFIVHISYVNLELILYIVRNNF